MFQEPDPPSSAEIRALVEPHATRAIRPLLADRTLVEAWSLLVEGGPELLLQRALTYNRLMFSPMSIVANA